MPRTSKDRGHYHTYQTRSGGGNVSGKGPQELWFTIGDFVFTNTTGTNSLGLSNMGPFATFTTAGGVYNYITTNFLIPHDFIIKDSTIDIDIYIGRNAVQDAAFDIVEFMAGWEHTTDDTRAMTGWNIINAETRIGIDTGNTANSLFYNRHTHTDLDLVKGYSLGYAIQFSNLTTNALAFFGVRMEFR